MRFDDTRAVAEVGYWVARGVRRRGVATRSVRLTSSWALRSLGIARLELMTRVENVASQGVAERAGFTREGVLRAYMTHGCGLSDVVMFSMIPADLPD
jgi:RimJ/RimL family protein N-acetyltransferase